LLFGLKEFKINRDWRTMKARSDCTQNYRNVVISQIPTR